MKDEEEWLVRRQCGEEPREEVEDALLRKGDGPPEIEMLKRDNPCEQLRLIQSP